MSDYKPFPDEFTVNRLWVHTEPRRQAEPKRDVFLTYVIIVKTNLEVHILNTFR